jgi:Tol biopolymer transport system component/DNA-binding winged helix-turn-helix (wHTH) protein
VPQNPIPDVIRFGTFEADLRAGELRRNGVKIRLQEQPFQVLAILLERPGEIVTREELHSRLWPADTFVDFDHGLNAAVKRLRDALGDSAENPRFVETLARRGYRLLAPATVVPRETIPAVPHAHPSWRKVLAVAVLLVVGVMAGWHAGHRSSAAVRFTERRLTANPENDPVFSAAISPDGKYLAFTGKTGIFLRAVGTGETHPVAMPSGGNTHLVSWFPDGSHVLATRSSSANERPSLWSVSVFGGTPRKLMDSAERGAVSPDGSQIVFVRGDYGYEEIWQMQSDGQQAHRILGQPGEDCESVVWSHDGNRIAFVRSAYRKGWEEADVSLGIHDLVSGKTNYVFSNGQLRAALAWSPDGRLIYSLAEPPPNQNDSNLWAIQIDARGNQAGGPPVRLTSGPDGKRNATLSGDGKRLTFLRWTESPAIYVSEVEPGGGRLALLKRLSLDERRNFPYTWTPDGKSVIFTSDRDGVFHLFKQAIDQPAPDLLVGGDQSVRLARLNADSSEILYTLSPAPRDSDRRMRLMRMPLSGGTPQLVFAEPGINNFQCARSPSNVCIVSEFSANHLNLSIFDPANGEKRPLKRFEGSDWYLYNWTLSPNGSTLALAKYQRLPGPAEIRLFRIAGGKERSLTLKDWSAISSLDWAADGRSIWVTASSPTGIQTLLHVDLQGEAKPVFQEPEKYLGWAIPSPNGRHVAIWEASSSSNAWLLEDF